MPQRRAFTEHPTPAKAYELGVIFATILRHVYTHPEFHYLEPPTADVAKMDLDHTPRGLFFTADFIQNTYMSNIIPFLPPDATRKCKELANAWAYADPTYQWEWVWDAEAGVMKDTDGNIVEFPRLPAVEVHDHAGDLATRNFFIKKLLLENGTDPQAKILMGGHAIDFGEDTKAEVQKLE
ncbi:hypothetical protein GQX73_g4168 [Xylaria multiplex]|uniref:Uncharacterized protein n=1 Tax=Xylaria multiplex TaxID=323545 RepID=A0A7C8MZH2_9PEZI|nr:hypothetical protein GQX73_g4168 [Xylaria multiplex]